VGDLLVPRLKWADLWAAFHLEISGHRLGDAVTVHFRPNETTGDRPVIFLLNRLVAMSREQARELRDELVATIERHEAAAGHGSEYLVQVALAPPPRD
jgi:hypothetical protein